MYAGSRRAYDPGLMPFLFKRFGNSQDSIAETDEEPEPSRELSPDGLEEDIYACGSILDEVSQLPRRSSRRPPVRICSDFIPNSPNLLNNNRSPLLGKRKRMSAGREE